MVSAAGENVGDLVMGGKEALNLPRRLEPFHDPLSSSGRLMGVFGPVIEATILDTSVLAAMFGGWTMPAYFFRSEPGAAELRRLARRESGRVCQRVLMIANMLEGMEHEEAARLAGLSRSAAYEWHNRYEEDGIEGRRCRGR